MFIMKNYKKIYICFIISVLLCTNKVFAVWYSGGSGSDVQSGLIGEGSGEDNSGGGDYSGQTDIAITQYPDPTEDMSDSELNEIAEKGNKEQREEASEIIAKREYERQNEEIQVQADEIDNEVDEVIKEEELVQEPVEDAEKLNEVFEEIDEDIEQAQESVEDKIEQTSEEEAENIEENDNKLQEDNSQTTGDPVRITKGSYEQNDIYFHFQGTIDFAIKRMYSSFETIVSGFGYGWSSNLDERIILGTSVHPDEMKNNLVFYSEYLKNKIEEYELKLAQNYNVPDIYKAEELYNERIKETKNQLSRVSKLNFKLSLLLFNAMWYEAKSDVEAVLDKTEALRNRLNNRITLFEKTISDIQDHLKRLEEYKEKYKNSLQAIESYEETYNLSIKRKKRNKAVMFSGMPLWYEETGLNTLTVIDENGYPHLFRENTGSRGIWKTENDKQYLEVHIVNDGYELIQKDGITKLFDENGFIIKIINRNKNFVLINRRSDGKIDSIETYCFEKLNF